MGDDRGSAADRQAVDATLTRIATAPAPRLPKLSRNEVLLRACEHWNKRNGYGWGHPDSIRPSSDEPTLARISVNYLRHELTGYERDLSALVGVAGADEARVLVKKRVLDAIMIAYPQFASECRRQIAVLFQRGSTPPPAVRRASRRR